MTFENNGTLLYLNTRSVTMNKDVTTEASDSNITEVLVQRGIKNLMV